jgi:hypothetical protein
MLQIELNFFFNFLYVVNKNQSAQKIKKTLFYVKIIFSGCEAVTPGGMTVRGRAVILKFNFSKSCDHKKSVFYWDIAFEIRMLIHPVYAFLNKSKNIC